ncbi:MAG TPA: hypothetical protein VMV54_08370 [Acidocella sp.]|nr:hypothetical protein [Acidocella sp.]
MTKDKSEGTVELNHRQVAMAARDAATVVLLRDSAEGVEVFMVKRHGLSDVLGGAYVFPAGKVDQSDADPQVLKRLRAPLDDLQAALGEPELDSVTSASFFPGGLPRNV